MHGAGVHIGSIKDSFEANCKIQFPFKYKVNIFLNKRILDLYRAKFTVIYPHTWFWLILRSVLGFMTLVEQFKVRIYYRTAWLSFRYQFIRFHAMIIAFVRFLLHIKISFE